MLFPQVHSLAAAIVLSYMLLPAPVVSAAWVGGIAVYYGVTSQNHPEHTGKQSEQFSGCKAPAVGPASSDSICTPTNMPAAPEAWFGRVEVVVDFAHRACRVIKRPCIPCPAGCRQWEAFRTWITTNMPAALEAWFGKVEVVRDGDAPFDPQQRHMFGYTPHGLFPIGAPIWLCWIHQLVSLPHRGQPVDRMRHPYPNLPRLPNPPRRP